MKIKLLLGALLLISSVALARANTPDPDRNSTTPTGWTWRLDRTEAQLNTMRQNGERIIDIERSPTNPGRFDAVLVSNSGLYQRAEGWWRGFNSNQVAAKILEKNGRITDIETYTVNGQRLFDFTLIRNESEAAKWWWWNYDLTPQQVADDINKHGIRLIDLDAYIVNGVTLYSYVGIKNQGVDQTAWWWYPNVTPEFVADKINEHGARLIDIETHDNGALSVVMVENNGAYWWWGHGLTQERMTEIVATTASRIITLESDLVNGQRRFAFISIDNANEETRRLRNLSYQAFDNPQFGDQVIRGFLVKQVDGPVLADQAGSLRFQPLSTLKLLPYLHTMIEIDQGNASLANTQVSWVEATVDDPNTNDDERKYQNCLSPGAPDTQSNSAALKDALPTMMWDSHNRTLDAVMEKYGVDNITQRAHQLGLTDTEMYYGCPQPNIPQAPWAANRSTLRDFAKLFEGVEKLQFVSQPATRQKFYDNMINLNYSGASYTSPISGKTIGPLYVQFLRDIVKREAGPAKQAIVEDFLKHVVLRGKGGAGGPSSDEFGYSDFLHVTLPFKDFGQIVPRTFVVGWFVYKLKTPTGCPESMANDMGPCQQIWQPEYDALGNFKNELQALPIRMALATWPTPTAPKGQIVKPTPGQVLYRNFPYAFEGNAWDQDSFQPLPCGSLTWTSNKAGDPFPKTGCAPQVTFTTLGWRTIRMTSTDASGMTDTDTVTVNVVDPPANSPPLVAILAPVNNAYLNPDTWITLIGKVDDPDNKNPITYQWVLRRSNGTEVVLGSGTANDGQQFSKSWKPSNNVPSSCGGSSARIYLRATDADGSQNSTYITVYIGYPPC